jgi:hypothetical protein
LNEPEEQKSKRAFLKKVLDLKKSAEMSFRSKNKKDTYFYLNQILRISILVKDLILLQCILTLIGQISKFYKDVDNCAFVYKLLVSEKI